MLAQNCTFICVSIAIRTKIGNSICNWLPSNTENGRSDNICDSIDLKDYICSHHKEMLSVAFVGDSPGPTVFSLLISTM
jgi:hypothetical protein